MSDFILNQILGVNGLVNLSNLVFIVALAVQGVLTLRVLSIASSIIIIPYYYLQQEPLWPSMFWSVAFVLINGLRVVQLLIERRPVILNEREQELYRLAFTSLDKRDYLRLVSLATWVACPAGKRIIQRGQVAEEAIILVSGHVEASFTDKPISKYRPGQLIGDANTYSGVASPVDIIVRSPSQLVKWSVAQLRAFLESRPGLRMQLLEIEGRDLSEKLHALAGI